MEKGIKKTRETLCLFGWVVIEGRKGFCEAFLILMMDGMTI